MGNRQADLQNLEFLGGLFDVGISLLQRSDLAGRDGFVGGDAGELEIKRHEAAGAEVLQHLWEMERPCLCGYRVPRDGGVVHRLGLE